MMHHKQITSMLPIAKCETPYTYRVHSAYIYTELRMTGAVQASMAFRHRRALSNTTCASYYAVLSRQMYSSKWSCCTQPCATTLHICWVAELYNSAVLYVYVLGRGAV